MTAVNESLENDHGDTNKYILLESQENEKYSIQINKTVNNILIEANPINNSNIYYKIELNLNDFYLLSKGFKMFDNLARHVSKKCPMIVFGSGAEYDKSRPLVSVSESESKCIKM